MDTIKKLNFKQRRSGSICIAGLRGIPDVMGGIETHCEELYPRLKHIFGNDIDIIVLTRRNYASKSGSYKGVKIVPIYSPTNKYLETIVHTALAVILARFQYKADVVHIHAIGPSLLVPLARLFGMKVVVTHHGEDYRRAKWNRFAKLMLMTGEAMAVRFSTQLIVITRNIEERLKATYGISDRRIRYISNGVDLGKRDTYDSSVLKEFDLLPGQYVLGVGRLVPEKGFQDLVKAWLSGDSVRRGRKLVIAGDADHRDKFAQELLANSGGHIVFTGRQTRSRVLALFHDASLFVLPSYHEGLPFVALEAIAAGTPIAVSDIPGNRELGLAELAYFKAGNVDEIIALLQAEPRCFKADPMVLDKYKWDHIAERTAALYQELLEYPGIVFARTPAAAK